MTKINNDGIEKMAPELPICPQCGLRTGHRASFTYWLFQENRCQCGDSQIDSIATEALPGAVGTIERPHKQILNDRYELLNLIGEGGMGFVYKARDVNTGNEIALKLMRPEFSQNNLAVKRVMQEVSIASRLSHLNLGQVHGYGQEKGGSPYMVMEFVPGRNLEEIIKAEGPLKPQRAMDIFIQICSGLQCAHVNGIIHRDLKPSNVIIRSTDGRERAIIVDFGFARLLDNSGSTGNTTRVTQTGEVFGSPAYMSPEQCLGEELDHRSDIYSFGCLMYEALTGEPPLVGENVLSTVARHIRESAQSLRRIDTRVPENIDAVVLNCLQREPVLRYQEAGDLYKDLEKAKKGEHIKGPSVKSGNVSRGQASNAAAALRQTSNAKDQTLSTVAKSVAAGAGIAGIVFSIIWFSTQKHQPADSQVQASHKMVDSTPTKSPAPSASAEHKIEEKIQRPTTPEPHKAATTSVIKQTHVVQRALPVRHASNVHSNSAVDWGSIGKLRQNK